MLTRSDGCSLDLRYKTCAVVDDPSLGLQLYYNLLWLGSFSSHVWEIKLRVTFELKHISIPEYHTAVMTTWTEAEKQGHPSANTHSSFHQSKNNFYRP